MYRFWLCCSKCTVRRNFSISLFLVFLKSVRLRDQSMDSFSPCGLLLPVWLGKVMAALLGTEWMVPRYGVSPENIILYGQSIGTVPTVDLASRYECAAVILHSPLMSGLRVAFPDTRKTYCFDAFPSIDKISKVTSPVLVIHGTEDEVIDFSHGLAMYERCPRAVEPLWVEGAGHNDIELYAQYLERLKQFISHELPNS
uniref:Alpha/beta hydrolase domain-containing protein 17C n=1 Tax=Ficedula albicollis TaxID=59894 RepID=A0A803VX87_FICAL